MRWTKRKWFWVLTGLLVAADAGYRLTRTAEFIARFGSDRARANLCRALPALSASRQEALLTRLLQDPVEDVRLACITACAKSSAAPPVDDLLDCA
ncbi:MAG: hypothetical protein HY291_02420, partial [Planctomycetes bacterium]|nr:hypothetical protein [Planctomycetota bacterium]